ncbi:hypothetical protein ACFPOU_11295 [Massilia jejuensis]|uniref:Uncharacterized protein n=1 Tax=Massilia jejuensis TaxID=648894 RepID=A0ABW0PJ02_9BURK
MTQDSSPATAPGALRSLKRTARQGAKAIALRAVAFVVARPRLDGFLRRQLFRFPVLAGRVRAAVARSRRADWQSLPTLPTDESELTDAARQVLYDLKRALERTRQP